MYQPRSIAPSGFEMLTVAGTPVGITAALLASGQLWAQLGPLETAEIRYTLDGTTPTAAIGHLVPVGATLQLTEQAEVRGFKAIRTGGVSGVIPVTVYR